MNVFKILALVFLGVAVVGGGAYLVVNNSVSKDEGKKADTEEVFNGGEYSLRGLMGLRQNVACNFSSTDPETQARMSGTVYVGGERVRGDYRIEQDGTSMESHMLVKEGKVYSWTVSPFMTIAHMMDLDEGEADTSAAAQDSRAVSVDDRVQYDCNVWNVDESKFTLPSDVDFKDLGATQGAGAGASGGVNTNAQCAACEYIPDADAKAECRAALSCE